MHFRTHYRLSAIPFIVVSMCMAAFSASMWIGGVQSFLSEQLSYLPWIVIGITALVPIAFVAWYLLSYAEVRRSMLIVRSMFGKQKLNLRRLATTEVLGKVDAGRSGRFSLMLHLTDEDGREVWLPLNSWRDEDLIMARVLRATVERRVRIDGDPMLVRRFSALLDTYKWWDAQQAAA